MFSKKEMSTQALLNKEINAIIRKMDDFDVDSPEYDTLLKRVAVLIRLSPDVEKRDNAHKLDPNTVLLAATNLAGIVMIVGYERSSVLTSKAMNLVHKIL